MEDTTMGPRDRWGPEDMEAVIEGMEEDLIRDGEGQPGEDEARAIEVEGAHSVERGEREARETGPGLSYRPKRSRPHAPRSP